MSDSINEQRCEHGKTADDPHERNGDTCFHPFACFDRCTGPFVATPPAQERAFDPITGTSVPLNPDGSTDWPTFAGELRVTPPAQDEQRYEPLTHITGIVRAGVFTPMHSGTAHSCLQFWYEHVSAGARMPEGVATFVDLAAMMADERPYPHDAPTNPAMGVSFWTAYDIDPTFHTFVQLIHKRATAMLEARS